ncbi:hypothetical protein GCM10010275_39290 [Streptomyces litmocidini]|nr:hypothetical protein GCM10010275_39290 [Streptomyces litmocidini]
MPVTIRSILVIPWAAKNASARSEASTLTHRLVRRVRPTVRAGRIVRGPRPGDDDQPRRRTRPGGPLLRRSGRRPEPVPLRRSVARPARPRDLAPESPMLSYVILIADGPTEEYRYV